MSAAFGKMRLLLMMWSSNCALHSASSNITTEFLLDMTKKLLITEDAVIFLGTFMVEMKRQQKLGHILRASLYSTKIFSAVFLSHVQELNTPQASATKRTKSIA